MQINFTYLKNTCLNAEYPLAERIAKLYEIGDWRDVVINSRLLLEELSKQLILLENLNPYYSVNSGEHRNLRSNLNYLRTETDYPQIIHQLFDDVRRLGNDAVHSSQFQVSQEQAWHTLCIVNDLLVFTLNSYDQKQLNYLRADMILAAQSFKRRTNHLAIPQPQKQNVQQAKQLLAAKKKKRHRFNFKKFFKH